MSVCQKKASFERRIAHLQSELDSSVAAQQRLHEAQLHGEQEMRALRASADDAQHDAANERATFALKLAEAQREASTLRLEMDRRHTEAVRREGMLQKSRDELASAAALAERDHNGALAAALDVPRKHGGEAAAVGGAGQAVAEAERRSPQQRKPWAICELSREAA